MTKTAQLCVLAGLTAIAAMSPVDASAQGCPDWFNRACRDSGLSKSESIKSRRWENQLVRTKATSSSEVGRGMKQARSAAADSATKSKPQQAKAPKPARSAKVGSPSGDLGVNGERKGTRLEPALDDEQKEALFQQFLEWKKGRLNAETNR